MTAPGLTVRRLVAKLSALVVVATGVVLLVDPAPVGACSCMESTHAEALHNSDAVFTGTFVDTLELPRWLTGIAGASKRLVFDVDRVFKGAVHERQTVVTEGDSASCGWAPVGEGPYLVFAFQDAGPTGDDADGELRTGACTATRTIEDRQVPELLGHGSDPLPGSSPAGEGVLSVTLKVAAVVAVLALVTVTTASVRRRLRRNARRRMAR